MTENEEKLNELLAKEAIRALALHYCIAADRNDMALMRELYLPDARDSRGRPNGLASEHIDEIPELRKNVLMVAHDVTNHLVWVDGAKAEGELRNLSHHIMKTGDGYMYMGVGGRFLDRYSCDASGTWRFAERTVVIDFVTRYPVDEPLPTVRHTNGLAIGSADEHDPIYGYFRDFERGVRKR